MLTWWDQSWYALGGLVIGLVLGRLWPLMRPPPPRENPWAGRTVRDLDGGERWTI